MMDMEIIPNYHPIFVHFTIGLLSISALLYLAGSILKNKNLLVAARWNLWIGAVITAGTIIAGFDAYNTVGHDAASHAAMTDHKNWALPTAGIFSLLALWALWKQRGAKTVSPVFVAAIVLASGLLAVTGYKGGEVVYRHGTGVMRMPEIHGDGGHGSHSHGEESANHHGMAAPAVQSDSHESHGHDEEMEDHHDMATPEKEPEQQENHSHDHGSHEH
ncbi:MAG: DUF2231 domain-containing protein [Rhodospirillales bacterium]|nr:DUF2231 domain-containing protein [Rhodospirillales bacterium]